MIRRREEGLTLIEVLVGLVLLASFIGGIYTVAIGTMQARQKIQQTSAIYTAGTEIIDIIERDIRGTYFYGVKDLNSFKATTDSLGGEQVTSMDLVTTTNSKNYVEDAKKRDLYVRADVTEVGYRMRSSDNFAGFSELYRREQEFFDDEPLKGGSYYLVYDRVVSLVVQFYEKPEEDTTGTTAVSSSADEDGADSWDSADKKELPFAAKIILTLGAPAEMVDNPEEDEKRYTFVRWVMFPTAYDEVPKQDDSGPGTPSGPGNNR